VDTVRPVPLTAGAVYAAPNAIPPDPVVAYASNRSALSVSLPRLSVQAFPIGIEIPDKAHANIAGEACHFLWGFRDDPTRMTSDGKNLFHNLVEYALHFQCAPPQPPPPQTCIAISKSANPINGSRVTVSDIGASRISLITYTLSYTLSNSPNCNNTNARIYDYIPEGTEFLPGSATDGVTPDPSRAMIWNISPGSSGSKQFTVVLLDAACSLNETIHNRAKIVMAGLPDSIQSNEVKHEQVCPPVHGDNRNPAFAQDELQVYPYPIVAGRQHTVSLRLINRTITDTTVTVRLQNSANAFGIGIPFTAFATRTVSIPALGNIIVEVPATFARSGHYCVCVEIDIPGYGTIRSCRNLDVMEDLRPGVPDTLTFAVGNPTPFTTDVMLDVDNTCAGFTAVVSPSILAGMAPGEVRQAQLVTTPPNPVTLGSGCHIDVRGYTRLGGRWQPMNEGIRKLDVPPVQIRHPSGIAPWLSPYISFREEPLRAGVPNSICIELQNPLDITKTVTLVYEVAQFGAGIGFTTIATRTVELPPHSIAKYCVDWTPTTADHYCVLVRVLQPNFAPQVAQRNVDVIRSPWRPELSVPVLIGNRDLISHALQLEVRQWGIDPFYEPYLRIPRPGGGGDPAPDVIGPGQQLRLELAFRPRAFARVAAAMTPATFGALQANPLRPLATPTFGDVQRVDVAVSMDGKDVSGFSAQFVGTEMKKVFLPMVVKQ
jgi:uncharacterized repeat protein (TIGR01451 family)